MNAGRLANLLIVGVPKAGTTSLFAYLAQHPDICGSDAKEIGYLNHFNPLYNVDRRPPPVESYMAHFAHCSGQRYALEATPVYFYGGQAIIDGIGELLDNPKIIIALRNPTDRLWSDYTFQRSMGEIQRIRSFEDYLIVCEQRRRDGVDLDPKSPHLRGLADGFYGDHISAWLEAFRDDVRVVFAENLAREPVRVLDDLFRWLDIDTGCISSLDLETRNVTVRPRSEKIARVIYSVNRVGNRLQFLPPVVRERLRRFYLRVNGRRLDERLDPVARRRVDAIYRASNEALVQALTAHGYGELPAAWLQSVR